jgi:hypothetical protein
MDDESIDDSNEEDSLSSNDDSDVDEEKSHKLSYQLNPS